MPRTRQPMRVYIYVCMCVYIYIYMYTHTHTHTHRYRYRYRYRCIGVARKARTRQELNAARADTIGERGVKHQPPQRAPPHHKCLAPLRVAPARSLRLAALSRRLGRSGRLGRLHAEDQGAGNGRDGGEQAPRLIRCGAIGEVACGIAGRFACRALCRQRIVYAHAMRGTVSNLLLYTHIRRSVYMIPGRFACRALCTHE